MFDLVLSGLSSGNANKQTNPVQWLFTFDLSFFFFSGIGALEDSRKKAFHIKEARNVHTHMRAHTHMHTHRESKSKTVLNSGELRVTFHPHPVRVEKHRKRFLLKCMYVLFFFKEKYESLICTQISEKLSWIFLFA